MSKYISILLIFFLFSTSVVKGQKDYRMVSYQGSEGLAHNAVSSIAKDADGLIWLGTWNGLCRYDGKYFRTYDNSTKSGSALENKRILQLVEGKMDRIWLRTYDKKIYWFDKKTGEFHPLATSLAKATGDIAGFNIIYSIDDKYVWIGTDSSGLYRINQRSPESSVKVFDTKAGLASNRVSSFLLDSTGTAWIGTDKGLYSLSVDSSLKGLAIDNPYLRCVFQGSIDRIIEDKRCIYVIYDRRSLLVLDKLSQKIINKIDLGSTVNTINVLRAEPGVIVGTESGEIFAVSPNEASPSSKYKVSAPIAGVFQDLRRRLWINTDRGDVICISVSGKKIASFQSPFYNTNSATQFLAFEDIYGRVWINAKGGGFGYYDEELARMCYDIRTSEKENYPLPQYVYNLFYDKAGVAWFSSEEKGLVKLLCEEGGIDYLPLYRDSIEQWGKEVRSVMKDSQNRVWVGTKRGDLFWLENNTLNRPTLLGIPRQGLGGLYALLEDKKGNIWIGSKSEGLFRAVPQDKDRTVYKLESFNTQTSSIAGNQVYTLFEDQQATVWIGTFDNGLFKARYNKTGVELEHISSVLVNKKHESIKRIRHIAQDRRGNIWLATTDGLFIRQSEGNWIVLREKYFPGEGLGKNDIQYLMPDHHGIMWLCTAGAGVAKVFQNRKGDYIFENFSREQGLNNEFVLSAVEDRSGDLWFATEAGLSKFEIATARFINLGQTEGVFGGGFAEKAVTSDSKGRTIFGTKGGLLRIDPEKMTIVSGEHPQLIFSLLHINHRPQLFTESQPIDIQYLHSLRLDHDKNNFSIDFSVTDYKSNNTSFSYRLLGLDTIWRENGNVNRAAFTGLAPGNYVLEVKASNNHYQESISRSIPIYIAQPWWKSNAAYVVYVIVGLGLIFISWRMVTTFLHLRQKITIEKRLTALKLNFFTQISHELRTPLTLILGPINQLLHDNHLSSEDLALLDIARTNALEMRDQVDQLLDLRKIQTGNMEIPHEPIDIKNLLKREAESFSILCKERDVTISVKAHVEQALVAIQEDKAKAIVRNLISNAIKFSPRKGLIEIEVWQIDKSIVLEVRDEGCGVSENEIKKIFNPFYSGDNQQLWMQRSSGIGLAYTQEIVNAYGGSIVAINQERKGLTIRLKLPQTAPSSERIKQVDVVSINKNIPDKTEYIGDIPEKDDRSVPMVLLVEDHAGLRDFLAGQLKLYFRVYVANDGLEGHEKALSLHPDLIISDIMMPRCDGISLLKMIRNNNETSHIPVVLLTAKSAVENQIEGLKCGADYYVTKPFDIQLLLASVYNLIEKRKQFFVDLTISRKTDQLARNFELTDRDASFLSNVIAFVDEHIGDPQLDIEALADALSLGRNTFYRKFKSLTHQTPVDFVRNMRLEKAKKLLENEPISISEVAYTVGFNDPKYFSKCFKKKFGSTPKIYTERIKSDV